MCCCSFFLCCCSSQMEPYELSDEDSNFIRIKGIQIHYKLYENQQSITSQGEGQKQKPIFILQHGFGANTSTWNKVIKPLSQIGTVLAYDRPAFGLTERKLCHQWKSNNGHNPYTLEFASDLPFLMLDTMGFDKSRPIILVGHSMGSKCCVLSALKYKSERNISKMILCAPAVYSEPPPMVSSIASICKSFTACSVGLILKLFGASAIRSAYYDESKLTEADILDYQKPLMCRDWQMSLVELTIAQSINPSFLNGLPIPDHLPTLKDIPTLVISGDHDRIVPLKQQQKLANDIPNATIHVITECGHNPHEEQWSQFLSLLSEFIHEKNTNTTQTNPMD